MLSGKGDHLLAHCSALGVLFVDLEPFDAGLHRSQLRRGHVLELFRTCHVPVPVVRLNQFSIANASVYEYLQANAASPFKWCYARCATIARMVLVLFS